MFEPEVHAHHEVAAPVLEDAVPVGEAAFGGGPVADLVGLAVPHPHRGDGLGDLLAVGADVLDRRRPRRSGDAAQALHARAPLLDGPGRELVPHLPGLDAHHVAAHRLDAAAAQQHHRPVEAAVADDDVAAPGQHQGRPGRGAQRLDGLLGGLGLDQAPRRAAEPQRRVPSERFARIPTCRGVLASVWAGVCHAAKPKLFMGYKDGRSPMSKPRVTDYLAELKHEAGGLRETAEGALGRVVPSRPDTTVAGLLAELVRLYRWTAAAVEAGDREEDVPRPPPVRLSEADALPAFDESLDRAVAALTAPPDQLLLQRFISA